MKKKTRANTFTRSEFRAISITLLVVVLGVTLPPYISNLLAGSDSPVVAVHVDPVAIALTDSVPADTTKAESIIRKKSQPYTSPPRHKPTVLDINSADSIQLKYLRGIGNVLSKRIIKFRDKLGGFYSIEQVGETYGLSPETYEAIRPSIKIGTPHRKLSLVNASVETLGGHPYISWDQARQLVNLVQSDDTIQTRNYLNTVGDSTWVTKVLPYFRVE